jgi:hypothetical protein
VHLGKKWKGVLHQAPSEREEREGATKGQQEGRGRQSGGKEDVSERTRGGGGAFRPRREGAICSVKKGAKELHLRTLPTCARRMANCV